jgi:transposase-like protein
MRTTHSAQEKVKVVSEAIQGLRTIGQIAADHNLNPNMVSKWKSDGLAFMLDGFQKGASEKRRTKRHESEKAELYQIIGQQSAEIDWLKKKSARL